MKKMVRKTYPQLVPELMIPPLGLHRHRHPHLMLLQLLDVPTQIFLEIRWVSVSIHLKKINSIQINFWGNKKLYIINLLSYLHHQLDVDPPVGQNLGK